MKLNKTQLEVLTKNFRPLYSRTGLVLFAAVCLTGPAYSANCDGELWRVADTKVISSDVMVGEIGSARLVGLGELHGVRGHVEAASCLFQKIAVSRPTALVVEHVSSSDQVLIDSFRSEHPETVSGLGKALQWWKTGWPSWNTYEPLFAKAWAARSHVYGADWPKGSSLPSRQMISVAYGDKATSIIASWADAMSDAQCKSSDGQRAEETALVQIGRDLAMARTIQTILGNSSGTVFFYAGRSHIRKDISIPFILDRKNISFVSISLQETNSVGQPVDRQKSLEEARGRYDYVWFIGEMKTRNVCDLLKSKIETRS